MKEIERIADAGGLPYRQMMENAGAAAFHTMREYWPEAKKIAIFIGKGNNGGDGSVAARLYDEVLKGGPAEAAEVLCSAAQDDVMPAGENSSPLPKITVILCEGEPVTEDAIYNYGLLKQHHAEGVRIMTLEECSADTPEIRESDLIVDALYGTGFHGRLRSGGQKACALMNGAGAPVCAFDLPSGLNADTGEIAEGAVRADLTVAFHCLKHGHVSAAAKEVCGEIRIVSIGIDT